MTTSDVRVVSGRRLLYWAEAGPPIDSPDHALEVIAAALGADCDTAVVPVARLAPEFLTLSTGVAGGFLQKLVNHGVRLVVTGDISAALDDSRALRDFVRECHRGRQIAFVRDDGELDTFLTELQRSTRSP